MSTKQIYYIYILEAVAQTAQTRKWDTTETL